MRRAVILHMLLIGSVLANDNDYTFSLKGSFTTSTRFMYNIDRVNSYGTDRTITSNLGYGVDVRANILWERFYLGFSAERIEGRETRFIIYPQYNYLEVPSDEGFSVLALELSGYYVVPISSENIRFYLGGGFGTYDGERNHSIAGVTAATVSSTSYIGIHVMTGIDYRLHSRIGLRFEIKFRDPHFDVTTKFDQSSVQYDNRTIHLPTASEVTKVNLFGVNYVSGIVVTL